MQAGHVFHQQDGVTVRFVRSVPDFPMGEYKPTVIDAAKAAADFRLVDVSGPKNRIVWRDGRAEAVTDARLAKLQQVHTWATDF